VRATLAGQHLDVPFAAVYLRVGPALTRTLVVGDDAEGRPLADLLPASLAPQDDDAWGLAGAGGLREVPAGVLVPGGAWGDAVRTAMVLPLASADPSSSTRGARAAAAGIMAADPAPVVGRRPTGGGRSGMDAHDVVPSGGGALGDLFRATDWSQTPLGPVSGWPLSLRSGVQTVLSSRYPMLLLWGDQLTQLYNDAYAELIGDKHPAALGDDVRRTLAEGWDVLEPLISDAMRTGVASWVPALQLLLERSGYREEAYFSVSHAPARDDDGVTVGVLTVCSEVTTQVVSERRLSILRDLSLRSGSVLGVESALEQVRATLAGQHLDVPFAAVYLRVGPALTRTLVVGDDADGRPLADLLPASLAPQDDDPWGLAGAGGLREVPAGVLVPGGAWGDAVRTAMVLPLASADPSTPLGVLLVGVSPARAVDEGYQSFLSVLGQQVAGALRKARAYEDERQRAEALAELDRAKTAFFTNVSHEFRTPLTLLLGPLEDALADASDVLPPIHRERLTTAHRNAQRLLRLVNDLLDVTALEAGVRQPGTSLLDLSAATVEHASAFRSAVERAGVQLLVDCPPLPHRVRVDPDHWETVVTNLLSNALKFTFVGQIAVRLHADDRDVVLEVADSGIGIHESEQERLFQRFARVTGARARSHEGSGIGLALVAELARLHGGDVEVDSVLGEGSTFRVRLPWSSVAPRDGDPAAPEQAPAPSGRAAAAAAAALAWSADDAPLVPSGTRADPELAGVRVVVADDNRDMRAYLSRLLEDAGCTVTAVGDGAAALRAAAPRAGGAAADGRDDAGAGRLRAAAGGAPRRAAGDAAGGGPVGPGRGRGGRGGPGPRRGRLPGQALPRRRPDRPGAVDAAAGAAAQRARRPVRCRRGDHRRPRRRPPAGAGRARRARAGPGAGRRPRPARRAARPLRPSAGGRHEPGRRGRRRSGAGPGPRAGRRAARSARGPRPAAPRPPGPAAARHHGPRAAGRRGHRRRPRPGDRAGPAARPAAVAAAGGARARAVGGLPARHRRAAGRR
jgi:signal transduction histidine kinase